MSSTSSKDNAQAFAYASLGVVLCGALVILGFGVLSYVNGSDPIEEPGLGPIPGAAGLIAALIVWWIGVYRGVRRKPGAGWALLLALSTGIVHLLVVTLCALPAGVAPAFRVATHLFVAWYSVVIVIAALLVAAAVATLVRLPEQKRRWPWEEEDDDVSGDDRRE